MGVQGYTLQKKPDGNVAGAENLINKSYANPQLELTIVVAPYCGFKQLSSFIFVRHLVCLEKIIYLEV